MSNEDGWIRILDVLSSSPSKVAFRALIALLDSWPNHRDLDDALAISERHLKDWPHSTRELVCEHPAMLKSCASTPGWHLTRKLTVHSGLANLFSEVGLDRLSSLTSLSCDTLTNTDTNELPKLSQLTSLNELVIGGNTSSGWEDFILSDASGNLSRLYLGSPVNSLSETSAQRLLEALRVKKFEVLGFDSIHSSGHFFNAFATNWNQSTCKLDIRGSLSASDLSDALANQAFASSITSLTLEEPHESTLEAMALAKCSSLDNIRYLGLRGGKLTDALFRQFAENTNLPSLRHLNLSYSDTFGQDLHWVSSLCADSLESLSLNRTATNTDSVLKVISSNRFSQLKQLSLAATPCDDRLAEALSDNGVLPDLDDINFGYTKITGQGIVSAFKPSCRSSIRSLRVSGIKLSGRQLRELVQPQKLPNLECLELESCGIEAPALEVFERVSPRLRELDLSYCPIGDRGLALLSQCPALWHLWILRLTPNDSNEIGDQGITSLAKSKSLCGLLELELGDIACSDQSMASLANSEVARTLEKLSVDRTELWINSEKIRPQLRSAIAAGGPYFD
jgi:hypothetical protein